MIKNILNGFKKQAAKLKKYTNVIDAARWSMITRKYTGSAVMEVEMTTENRAVAEFRVIGFLFYIFWNSLYVYCAYMGLEEDQTILRNLYHTKLKRYGDDFERVTSFIYILLTMWLTPFRLSGNTQIYQLIIDLDKLIQNVGENIAYYKIARATFYLSFSQVCVCCIRMICIWIPTKNGADLPFEKIFQVVYSDAQAISLISIYCYFLITLRDRFRWINKMLNEIKMRNSWEYKVFARGRMTPNILKVVQLQDRHVCEKIKTCARVYSMLYNVSEIINGLFGFALLLTLLHYLNYIIIYLFYFMEATATGLFHDSPRYIDFLIYAFWEIAIALGIIYLIIYSCESVMREAKHTSYMVHDIINGDLSEAINNDVSSYDLASCRQAMQLSIQLLHQKPRFTVMGLIDLNYALLQQGSRSVLTYLVILLQFATGSNDNE